MPRIGQSVIDNFLFLKKISRTKSDRKRNQLLRLATNSELFSIIEICYNILKGRSSLTQRQKNRILPHIDIVRKIGRSRSQRGLRQVLQRGGGIGAIAAILTPILIEAFRHIRGGGGEGDDQ
jgi:hypothetical protein